MGLSELLNLTCLHFKELEALRDLQACRHVNQQGAGTVEQCTSDAGHSGVTWWHTACLMVYLHAERCEWRRRHLQDGCG